jgi:hypothetical protein
MNKLNTLIALTMTLTLPVLAESTFDERLQVVYRDYTAMKDEQSIEQLVRLDAELREVTSGIHEETVRTRTTPSAEYFKEEYAGIGLYIGHYSGVIEYSGALLEKAHQQDPNSSLRSHTLFSTVAPRKVVGEHDGMPDLNAAFRYVAEFPEGPFSSQTFEVIATCYDDFYKSLRKFMTKKIYEDDIHMGCFKPFMTAQPYEEQLVQVQVLALQFYDRAVKSASADARQSASVSQKMEKFKTMLGAEDKSEFEVWYWCSDC